MPLSVLGALAESVGSPARRDVTAVLYLAGEACRPPPPPLARLQPLSLSGPPPSAHPLVQMSARSRTILDPLRVSSGRQSTPERAEAITALQPRGVTGTLCLSPTPGGSDYNNTRTLWRRLCCVYLFCPVIIIIIIIPVSNSLAISFIQR